MGFSSQNRSAATGEAGAVGVTWINAIASAQDVKYSGSEYASISSTSFAIVARSRLLLCLIAESFFASCW
jgi:hypothetical protein